jgi:hypothetical protein
MKYNSIVDDLNVQPKVLRHCALDVFRHIQHEVHEQSVSVAAIDLGSFNCFAFLFVGHSWLPSFLYRGEQ